EELQNYCNKKQEYFLSITLDGASHIINTRTVFIGTLNQSMVHPREVFANAIADRAAGIIIAHNHPSGTLRPSQADIHITKRLKEVSKLVGIELLDHVILSQEGYYSFSDEGLL
ncbi:MAG: JAB domain-containing protein, partial [Sulfurovum sp.]|nr:JAB domain-containing protein [Sulfurovum sp.]